MDSQPLIQFQQLSKSFGRGSKAVRALTDLDLAIASGQAYGFLGRNGAGKTTTIRLILGLIRPTDGRALLYGQDVRANPSILRRVGALVEDPGFYSFMSGRDNLITLVRTTGEMPDERVDHLLELVGLAARADQLVAGYSKGMRQRLGIAAALLGNPDLVILDEPTNGLDPKGIQEIRALIRGLVDVHGKTVFLSSHLLAEVEQTCDYVTIINHGKKVCEDKVSELMRKHEAVEIITPAKEEFSQYAKEKGFKIISENANGNGVNFLIEGSDSQIPEITRDMVSRDIQIFKAAKHQKILEEIFVELTGNSDIDGESAEV